MNVINTHLIFNAIDRSNLVLEEYHLTTAEGCINHIIDAEGNHYFVPNYCINDPYFEKNLEANDNVEEKPLKLKLFEPTENINIEIETTNLITGEELKKKFRKKAKIPIKQFGFRLFFAGNEIKNEHFLYQHKLDNDYKIQVMKVPKSERPKNRRVSQKEKVEANINSNSNNNNNVNNYYNEETDG